jgi:hypothetical protein
MNEDLRLLGSFDPRNRGGVVRRVEDGGTGDQGVGPGVDDLVRVGRRDAPVDFNPRVDVVLVAQSLDLLDLLHLRFDEGLTAEARVDGHDQNQVDDVDDVLQARNRGPRVQHDARFATQVLDLTDSSVQVNGTRTFSVNGDDVRTRLCKVRNSQLRFHDHQVRIQNLVRDRSQGINNQRANGDVRHKSTVHDVDVDPFRAGFVHRSDFLAEFRKVRRQDGRGNDDGILVARVDFSVGDDLQRASLGRRRRLGGGHAQGLSGVGNGGEHFYYVCVCMCDTKSEGCGGSRQRRNQI